MHLRLGKLVSGIVAPAPNLSIMTSLNSGGANGSIWISFRRSMLDWRSRRVIEEIAVVADRLQKPNNQQDIDKMGRVDTV